eukprot:2745288-Rhodomonas_salina.1
MTSAELASVAIPAVAAVMMMLYIRSPIEAAEWSLPPLRGMPTDNRLSESQALFEGKFPGAEHIHVDCAKTPCTAYTGLADGNVVRWNPDEAEKGFEVLVRTACVDECPPQHLVPQCGALPLEHICGRPLAVHLTPDSKTLLIVDPYKGLLALKLADMKLSRVASTYEDTEGNVLPVNFLNSVTVSKRGAVYLTQSSIKFERRHSMIELMEGQASGSLLEMKSWNQKGPPKLVTRNITFANGVLVDETQSFALVAETSRSRIKRVDLKTHAITVNPYLLSQNALFAAVNSLWCGWQTFVDDLQGSPDNLAWGVGKDGMTRDYSTVWVACPAKRTGPFAFANFLGDKPAMRQIFATILYSTGTADWFHMLLPKTGVVIRLKVGSDGTGSVEDVLLDYKGKAATQISSVAPHRDTLLMGAHTADVTKLMVSKL